MIKMLIFAIGLNVALVGQGSDARVIGAHYRPASKEWHVNVADFENNRGYVFDTDGNLEVMLEF